MSAPHSGHLGRVVDVDDRAFLGEAVDPFLPDFDFDLTLFVAAYKASVSQAVEQILD